MESEGDPESSIGIVTTIKIRLRSLEKINSFLLAKEQFADFCTSREHQLAWDCTALFLGLYSPDGLYYLVRR